MRYSITLLSDSHSYQYPIHLRSSSCVHRHTHTYTILCKLKNGIIKTLFCNLPFSLLRVYLRYYSIKSCCILLKDYHILLYGYSII